MYREYKRRLILEKNNISIESNKALFNKWDNYGLLVGLENHPNIIDLCFFLEEGCEILKDFSYNHNFTNYCAEVYCEEHDCDKKTQSITHSLIPAIRRTWSIIHNGAMTIDNDNNYPNKDLYTKAFKLKPEFNVEHLFERIIESYNTISVKDMSLILKKTTFDYEAEMCCYTIDEYIKKLVD